VLKEVEQQYSGKCSSVVVLQTSWQRKRNKNPDFVVVCYDKEEGKRIFQRELEGSFEEHLYSEEAEEEKRDAPEKMKETSLKMSESICHEVHEKESIQRKSPVADVAEDKASKV